MKPKSEKQPAWSKASTQDIMMVQESLSVMGLYNGPVDGLAGPATLRAVRTYKKSIHMAPSNHLTDAFIEHLRYHT